MREKQKRKRMQKHKPCKPRGITEPDSERVKYQKKGENMPGLIVIERVLRLTTKTHRDEEKGLVTSLAADVVIAPGDLAELHGMLEKGVPLKLSITTRQAEFGKDAKDAKPK